jgi:hypothetical protein
MMFSRRLGLAALALVLASPALAAPPGRPSRQYTIEQFLATTAISGASFSADEKKILFSSNKTGIYNVYSVPVAGGEPLHPPQQRHGPVRGDPHQVGGGDHPGDLAPAHHREVVEPCVQEREPRLVHVNRYTIDRIASPEIDFTVLCSKGFYVRTYVHDIGEVLGCGAHLKSLRRTKSGRFDVTNAITVDAIKNATREDILKRMLSLPEVSRMRGA